MIDGFAKIDLVLNFFNRDEILMEKLMGRRVCPSCSKNYNVADINTADGYVMKPLLPKKDPHFCDDCPSVHLVVRDDDKESIIRDRMALYKKLTEPILEYYESQGRLQRVDASSAPSEVYSLIEKIVENN